MTIYRQGALDHTKTVMGPVKIDKIRSFFLRRSTESGEAFPLAE